MAYVILNDIRDTAVFRTPAGVTYRLGIRDNDLRVEVEIDADDTGPDVTLCLEPGNGGEAGVLKVVRPSDPARVA
ncbi:hypothetical protein GCM10007301_15180 [Azorhizobium oxalatiphilum]|uniref:Uncharacterized protein n=1 Tax=Azorhizobium oxalatiphilum TaxID=980631 RepID=A0A917BRX8_9HYPH|nr:hypothetical protein [Azorhizobium oxalatiphilum]GGF56483.1 hypothetical protein GCM10007301_15180 [Azorhizobium oxalatiphilum]